MNKRSDPFRFETLTFEGPDGKEVDGAPLVATVNRMLDDGYRSGAVAQLLMCAAAILAVDDGLPGEGFGIFSLNTYGQAVQAHRIDKHKPRLVLVPGRDDL